jgi:hypothetical protein
MSAPAAISGTFADFRTVKGRKVAQLVIEVPIEQADAALLALGGVPRPDDAKWVALARLDTSKAADEPRKNRKAWADLPPSQQAAMRSDEGAFWKFLEKNYDRSTWSPEAAAEHIRQLCGVHSRRDLNDNHKARVLWHQLDREFLVWSGRLASGIASDRPAKCAGSRLMRRASTSITTSRWLSAGMTKRTTCVLSAVPAIG